ncbi:MAG: hypothetical protein N2202_05115 [Proteobacteria bacterium]|nr:hypothetical protein [Pseudomonadota bacterium]
MKVKIFFLILLFLIIFFASNYSKIYSFTCLNCHNPNKYYEPKERSFHSGLECTSCHTTEGLSYWVKLILPAIFQRAKYYTRHHKVEISNCIKCHKIENLTTKNSLTFSFSHKKHFDVNFFGDNLLCQNCHLDVAHAYNYKTSKYICFLCHKITTPSNPENCFYCHINLKKKENHPNKNCDNCHIIEPSDSRVNMENCLICHKNLKFQNNLKSLHNIHKKTGSVTCFSCHNKTIHRK